MKLWLFSLMLLSLANSSLLFAQDIIASPNPIPVTAGQNLGQTTISWNSLGHTSLQVRINSPSGTLFASGGQIGQATTGVWVTPGMTFYLVDPGTGVTVDVISVSLKEAMAASPSPIPVSPGATTGTTNISWYVPGHNATEVHLNSPSGPLFTSGGATGTADTGNWVTEGMSFYLVDSSSSEVLGSYTMHLDSSGSTPPSNQTSPFCLSTESITNNAADVLPPGQDGYVHIPYAFVDDNGNFYTPTDSIARAVQTAVDQWNLPANKAMTGIELDPLPADSPASRALISFALGNDDQSGNCTKANTIAGKIYYNVLEQQAADSHPGYSAFAFKHEIGHMLGLTDASGNPTTPTVMNVPTNALPSACTTPNVPTMDVTTNDTSTIPACMAKGRTVLAANGGGSFSVDNTNVYPTSETFGYPYPGSSATYSCIYYTSTVNFYVDGQYDSSQDFITQVNCY